MDRWSAANKALWEEWTEIHVRSEFYDVEGWKAGRHGLPGLILDEVGDVAGKDLLHLQCHFGLDTLLGKAGRTGHRGRLLRAGDRARPRPERGDRP